MAKQINHISEISVSYYPANSHKPIITKSEEAYNVLKHFFPVHTIHLQESFVVLYLNRCNRVIGVYPLSLGGISGTIADVRLILSVALKSVASCIMLAHNHPSGSLSPSKADSELTIHIIIVI